MIAKQYERAEDPEAKVPGTNVPMQLGAYSQRLVERAITNGWAIKDEWKAHLPAVLATMAADPKRGDKSRRMAIQLLRQMEQDNVNALLEADRMERLDSGRATEHVANSVRVIQIPPPRVIGEATSDD